MTHAAIKQAFSDRDSAEQATLLKDLASTLADSLAANVKPDQRTIATPRPLKTRCQRIALPRTTADQRSHVGAPNAEAHS